MVYTFVKKSPLHGLGKAAGALSDVLEKRAERTYQREQKEEERYYQEQLEATERQKKSNTSRLLQEGASKFGPNPTMQDVQTLGYSVLAQDGDTETVNQFFKLYEPIFKEQAKSEAFKNRLETIFGDEDGTVPQQDLMPLSPEGGALEEGLQSQNGDLVAPEQIQPSVSAFQDTIGPEEQQDFSNELLTPDSTGKPQGITQGVLPPTATPKQIAKMYASGDPNIAKMADAYTRINEQKVKTYESDRDYNFQATKKAREEYAEMGKFLPKRQRIIEKALKAIKEGNLEAFTPDHIASLFPGWLGDFLRTKAGADLGLAIKENLVLTASEIAAKGLNQFMEMRMLDAFARMGQSDEANESIVNTLKMENELENVYRLEYQKIEAQDKEFTKIPGRQGFEVAGIENRARNAAFPEQQKIMNKYSILDRRLQEREGGWDFLIKQAQEGSQGKRVAQGTPLTYPQALAFIALENGNVQDPSTQELSNARDKAKALGYVIYTSDQLPPGGVQ